MIKKEDIKVGLEFYITRKNCLKCNFDPLFVHDDNIPVLFRIERNDDCTYLCTSADSNHEFFAHFDTESIMKFGVAIAAGGESRNEKTEQVSHPSHYAWLKDLCGVEPLDICRHLDFNTGNAIKYLLRKDKVDGNKTKTEKRIEDLRKAVFYIQDEIKLLEHGTTDTCKDCFFFKDGVCNNPNEIRFTSEENPSCTDFEYKEIKVEL